MMHWLRVFWIGARPRTFPAAIVPVLVGGAFAWRSGAFAWGPFLAALTSSIFIQIGTNLANDVADYLRGADKQRKGPTRITQAGLATPHQTKMLTALSFGIAAVLGAYLISVGGWPILLIGIISIVCGIAYTAGPFPLAYNGLGDVFAFLFFGVVAVCGTVLLLMGRVPIASLIASLPVAMLVTNIIIVNNVRDIPTDRLANKRTLAVLIGARASKIEYSIFALGACFIACALWGMGMLGGRLSPWLPIAFAVITLLLAWQRVLALWRAQAPMEYNRALAATAQHHLIFGLLFAISIVMS